MVRKLSKKQQQKIRKKLQNFKTDYGTTDRVNYNSISIKTDKFEMINETHMIPNNDIIFDQIQRKIKAIGDIFDGTKHATLHEVSRLFDEVLTYQIPLSSNIKDSDFQISILESSFLPLSNAEPFSINKGKVSFRIRNDATLMEKEFSEIVINDFGIAPKEFVKLGRLNKPNEPIFYLADSPQTAIKEVKMKQGDYGYISIYTCEEELKFKTVLSEGSNLNDLMFRLFSENVEMSEENKYLLTQEIVNRYFGRSDEDGWLYPSIANDRKSYCIAIDERKMDKLSYNISFKIQIIEEGLIKVESLILPNTKGNLINYPFDNKIITFNPDDFLDIWFNAVKKINL